MKWSPSQEAFPGKRTCHASIFADCAAIQSTLFPFPSRFLHHRAALTARVSAIREARPSQTSTIRLRPSRRAYGFKGATSRPILRR